MAWSYSDDPSSSDRDYVRFWVDKDSSEPKLTDAEIDAIVAEESTKREAAAVCAENIAGQYAMGSPSHDQYIQLAKLIRRQAAARGVTPTMPARSIADKDSAEDDSDRVAPRFVRGQGDFGDTGSVFRSEDPLS